MVAELFKDKGDEEAGILSHHSRYRPPKTKTAALKTIPGAAALLKIHPDINNR